jgi:two-component system, NtrC family, sensor kinase
LEAKGRILIVDDSEVVLEQSRAALAAAGYIVTTTSQTVGVSSKLRDADLIIIDFHMPGLDGKHLMASIRNATQGGKHNFLAYLYTSDEEAAGTFRALGFDGYLGQKGDPKALVTQVEAAFRRIQLRALSSRYSK